MGLSVQKMTLHNYERPLDGEASLALKKWIEQIIKKREGRKWNGNAIKTNLNTTDGRQIEESIKHKDKGHNYDGQ